MKSQTCAFQILSQIILEIGFSFAFWNNYLKVQAGSKNLVVKPVIIWCNIIQQPKKQGSFKPTNEDDMIYY